jgi:hypothetical protein
VRDLVDSKRYVCEGGIAEWCFEGCGWREFCSNNFLLPVLLPQARWSTLSGAQLSSAVVALHSLGFTAWPEGFGAALAAALGPQFSKMEAQPLLWAAQVSDECFWGGGGGNKRYILV